MDSWIEAYLDPGLPAVAEGVRVLNASAVAIPVLALVGVLVLAGPCSDMPGMHQLPCSIVQHSSTSQVLVLQYMQ